MADTKDASRKSSHKKIIGNHKKCLGKQEISFFVVNLALGLAFSVGLSILGPYEANSPSDRTPSMRKWVSTFCVICPCSASLHCIIFKSVTFKSYDVDAMRMVIISS